MTGYIIHSGFLCCVVCDRLNLDKQIEPDEDILIT